MFRIGLPFSGKVMRKNLAVCGSDWFALAKPFKEEAIVVVVHDFIWFCEDPAKLYPIVQRVMSGPM